MIEKTITQAFISQIETLKKRVEKLDEAMNLNKKTHDELWDTASKALLYNVSDDYYNETLQLIQDSYVATQDELELLQLELGARVHEVSEEINKEMRRDG